MTGIVVFAHGSSVGPANEAICQVAGELARAGGYSLVEAAFLDIAHPDLPEAIERLAARGARRVIVVPYFLMPGLHLERDLPRIVKEIQSTHQDLTVQVTEPLDGHPALLEILLDRVRAATDRGA